MHADTMSTTDVFKEATKLFTNLQLARIQIRAYVLSRGLASAFFWTAAVILGAWLEHFGMAWLGWTLFSAWLFISAPALLLQVLLVLDLLFFGLTRRALVYPVLHMGMSRGGKPVAPPSSRSRLWATVAHVATVTSPLSALATWTCCVLSDHLEAKPIATIKASPGPALERRGTLRRKGDRRTARGIQLGPIMIVRGPNDLARIPLEPYWECIDRPSECQAELYDWLEPA